MTTLTPMEFGWVMFTALWVVLVPSLLITMCLVVKTLKKCVDMTIQLMLYCLCQYNERAQKNARHHQTHKVRRGYYHF